MVRLLLRTVFIGLNRAAKIANKKILAGREKKTRMLAYVDGQMAPN